jgi:integrase
MRPTWLRGRKSVSIACSRGNTKKRPSNRSSGEQPALFSEVRNAYLKTHANGAVESNTLKTATTHLRHLGETLGETFSMVGLTLAHLQEHIERRRADVASTTIEKEIDTFRAAWNWACRMGMTQGVFPNTGLVYPKTEEKLPFMTFHEIERHINAGGNTDELRECLFLTHTEITELLDHVEGRRIASWIYPAFTLTAHTGARRSEMMRARPEDVDLAGGTVTIREKKRARGKRTTRRVPLTNRLADALAAWLAESGGNTFLFGLGTRMRGSQTVQKAFHRALKGSRWQVLRGWHVLRHSFISALASRGVDQRLIDDFVGHQTEEQRRRYRHLYPSVQQKAIQDVFD